MNDQRAVYCFQRQSSLREVTKVNVASMFLDFINRINEFVPLKPQPVCPTKELSQTRREKIRSRFNEEEKSPGSDGSSHPTDTARSVALAASKRNRNDRGRPRVLCSSPSISSRGMRSNRLETRCHTVGFTSRYQPPRPLEHYALFPSPSLAPCFLLYTYSSYIRACAYPNNDPSKHKRLTLASFVSKTT